MITYLRVTVFNLFKDLSQVFMRLTWLFHNKLQKEQGASNTFGEVVDEWVMHRGQQNFDKVVEERVTQVA